MKQMKKWLFLFALISLGLSACATKKTSSILLRDLSSPPQIILEKFAQEGKSDFILLNDSGYSYRLIYLCENRIYNFLEEPEKNPILVSLQPIMDTPVEKRLGFDDRRRIWACMERKVQEEQYRIEEIRRRVFEERIRLEMEIRSSMAERDRILGEIEKKRQLAEIKQRLHEEEARRAEKVAEERLRKQEEELRKKSEEEYKIKSYKAGEKEKEQSPPPPSLAKITRSGVFLVMKEAYLFEDIREASKAKAKVKKYDIFDVAETKKDIKGANWFQVILGERIISEKLKKTGWSPEEKSYWTKNKLLVWVYPGDLSKIQNVKPLKLDNEIVHYTGKKYSIPQKSTLFEVTYEVKTETFERITGWIEERTGIFKYNNNIEEIRTILNQLSTTLWPIRIQNDILRGNIRVGFTPDQVTLSLGKPDHVNSTTTLVGIHEQWVYGEPPFPKAYVYFENGLVKSWEFLKKDAK
ncbi:MAG: hypothetical protein NTY64_17680 [Deltaproteobacteria bacterium]|nr:hypothetical protein [Deltaproteobacteria bacterium]